MTSTKTISMENENDVELQKGRGSESAMASLLVTKNNPKLSSAYVYKWYNLGDMTNLCTFIIMILGILIEIFAGRSYVSRYVLAFGLFGFAGGVTNWLAVRMLFDRIPFLAGSGVIPRQFKEIRHAIKENVMEMFFDETFLEHYLETRSRELISSMNLPAMLRSNLNSSEFDIMFKQKLVTISQKPEGMLLQTMGQMFGGVEMMAPMLKPMLISFGEEMVVHLVTTLDIKQMISVAKIRTELDVLMTEKLLELTPERVKEILENVIRDHLGWLVVWGNVFGGLIGILSILAGYKG